MLVQFRYLIPYILITAFQYFVAKDALSYASPFVYGALTSLVGCVVLFSSMKRFRLILNRDTLLFCAFFWLSGACWLLGLDYISPPQSAVISFTMPLFVIPLAVLILKERSSRPEVYGAVVGFAGILLFNLPLISAGPTLLGATITTADAFFWALYSVYMGKLRSQDTLQTLATGFFFGFILYALFSLADFSLNPTLELGGDILFLGLIGFSLNFYFWMAMIKTEKVGRLTTIVFAAPVITLAYSVATTGVVPGYITMLGVALIFVGIYAANIFKPGPVAAQRGS